MKREVGLWIDRRKAVIVTIENEVEVTREIRSNIDKQPLPSVVKHSKSPGNPPELTAEGKQADPVAKQLDYFYEGIVSFIRDADSILIFGPDKARLEFEEHLKRGEFRGRIEGVEPVGKMSDHQVAVKVRDYFLGY